MSVPVTRRTVAEQDRLDVVTRDLLGAEGGGNLEAVLKANPGLAAGGLFVPAGRRLAVSSAAVETPVLPSINPWE